MFKVNNNDNCRLVPEITCNSVLFNDYEPQTLFEQIEWQVLASSGCDGNEISVILGNNQDHEVSYRPPIFDSCVFRC